MAELNDPHFHALKVRAKIHAMGTTYLCHPANRVQRIDRAPRAVPLYTQFHDEIVLAPWATPGFADRIAEQFIQDAIGLFRAPGFNGRRYPK
jgi:hypothetical protein